MTTTLHIRLRLPRADFLMELDLQLPAQGITVLYGHSGSGKTSVLRCVAGLERAGHARIGLGDEVWQDDQAKRFVPPHRRPIGYVFQEASLFEHLDVSGNLHYGRKRARHAEAAPMLQTAIDLLGIRHLLNRRVAQLSGGERQRVAIARALATMPRLLLLDEPLAALDGPRRREIMPWLEKLKTELDLPMLYVTHSTDELARLADHLVVLEQGKVKAAGPVHEMLSRIDVPLTLGDDAGALIEGEVAERSAAWHLARIDFNGGSLWLRDEGSPVGRRVRLRVLARDVSLTTVEPAQTSIQNHIPCVVESIAPDAHPSQVLLRLQCGSAILLARITRRAQVDLGLQPASRAWALVKSVALVS
jgi:molybdate transport system ATP-binding protein